MTILSRSAFPSRERGTQKGREERGKAGRFRGEKYSSNEDGAMQPGSGGKWI